MYLNTCISITPTLLIRIRYCCGKHCELLLNRFLIKDLHHILNLLRHLPLSSIIDEKIRPPPLFQPVWTKNVDPPTSSLDPRTYKKSRPLTSILTIRSLSNRQRRNKLAVCLHRHTSYLSKKKNET